MTNFATTCRRLLCVVAAVGASSPASGQSAYDELVLRDRPVLYLAVTGAASGPQERDLSGNAHDGAFVPPLAPRRQVALPNDDRAVAFDGDGQYLEVASAPQLSVPTTGVLSCEAWLRPQTLEFQHQEAEGFVYWSGKGGPGQQEYAGRLYSLTNSATPPRPSRLSAYAFNLTGGLGSGSYVQEPLAAGAWLHVAFVVNAAATSPAYPTGYVRLYKNGVLRKTTSLGQFGVVPGAGTAPLRLATRDLRSFFAGAVAKFAIYDYELSAARVAARVALMSGGG